MRLNGSINWIAGMRVATLLILGLSWECIAGAENNPKLFPTIPQILLISFPSFGLFSMSGQPGFLAASRVLLFQTVVTLSRIAIALSVGMPLGIVFGLTIQYFRRGVPLASWFLIVIRSVPLLALIPLFVYWFGTSWSGVIIYIAFGIFLVVASDTYQAATEFPTIFLDQAYLLGRPKAIATFWDVYLPGIQPSIFASLRNVLGFSWALALGAEYVSATSGLGYIAYQCYLYSDTGKLAVLTFLYMALGYGTFHVSQGLFKMIAPWAPISREAR